MQAYVADVADGIYRFTAQVGFLHSLTSSDFIMGIQLSFLIVQILKLLCKKGNKQYCLKKVIFQSMI